MATGTQRALSGIKWLSLGKFSAMAVQLISTAIVARILAPADYGVFAAAWIVISFSAALFDGAFAIGIVHKKEIDDDYVGNSFLLSQMLAGILFLLVLALTPLINLVFDFSALRDILPICGLALFFKAADNISESLLRRHFRFRLIFTYQVICGVIGNLGVSIYLALHGYGVWALVWGNVSTIVMSSVASVTLARIPLRITLQKETLKDIGRTSGYFSLSQVANWAAVAGSNIITGALLGATALGIYSRGWRLLDNLTYGVSQPMQNVLTPTFARMQEDAARAAVALRRALEIAVPFFAVVSALAFAHAPAIVAICLGAQWGAVVPIVQILFAALVARCCYKITESLTVGFGKSKSAATRQILYAAMMLGGSYAGSFYGPIGVAVGASAAVVVFYISSVVYAAYLVGLDMKKVVAIHLKALLLAIIVLAVDYGVQAGFADQFWFAHIAGGAVSSALLLVAVFLLPARFIGNDMHRLRRAITARLHGAR